MENEELKKQAQKKLSEARRLIKEAGDLAEQGCFTLHFGEIGDYVPRVMLNREHYRTAALERARRDYPTMDEMSEEERNGIVDDYISDWMADDVGYQRMESIRYGESPDDVAGWWHPSRC